MKMLLWDKFNKFICDDFGEIPLESKPTLSFQFDELRLVHGLPSDEYWLTVEGNNNKQLLTQQQITEVKSFIDNKRAEVGELVMAVDSSGKYLGKVSKTDPRFSSEVSTQPPTLDPYRFKNGEWVRVYPIDELGYITTEEQSIDVIYEPPVAEKTKYSFSENTWVDPIPLSSQIENALIVVVQILLNGVLQDIRSFDNQKYIDFIKQVCAEIENISNSYPEKTQRTVDLFSRLNQTIEELTKYSKERNDIQLSIDYLRSGFTA